MFKQVLIATAAIATLASAVPANARDHGRLNYNDGYHQHQEEEYRERERWEECNEHFGCALLQSLARKVGQNIANAIIPPTQQVSFAAPMEGPYFDSSSGKRWYMLHLWAICPNGQRCIENRPVYEDHLRYYSQESYGSSYQSNYIPSPCRGFGGDAVAGHGGTVCN